MSRRVILLDVRTDVFAYLKGHLPGAEYLNSETLRASEGGIPTRLLSAGEYAALFSRLGIDPKVPVVIYSAGETRNIDATFTAWLSSGSSSSGPWCSPIPGFR
jgi:3-mercaptopyruvate sulfurtransferase SseA